MTFTPPGDGINQEMEEVLSDTSTVDSFEEQTLCQSCSRTFKSIWNVLKYKEMYLPLIFFFVQGILLPNFDDLHYVFLTGTCGMSKATYDFLNVLTYVLNNFFFPHKDSDGRIYISFFLCCKKPEV